MNFKEQYTERLNLNISPYTYNRLKEEADIEGRKVGNMARIILDRYATNKDNKKKLEDYKFSG
jgi:hypothetical protein